MNGVRQWLEVFGAITVMVGAIGGVWSPFDRLRKWRDERPYGDTYLATAKRKSEDGLEVDYLVSQDWFGFIKSFRESGAEVLSLEALGRYLKATLRFPELGQTDAGENQIAKE